jgi:dihydrolipoamide dehydrogenase
VVKELKVKLGDKVAEGSLVLTLEADAPPQPRRLPPPRHEPAAAPASKPRQLLPCSASFGGNVDGTATCRAGRRPGGYSAAFRAADLGLKVVSSSATPPWAACA